MAWSKQKIVANIEVLMRKKFTDPKEAFNYYDADKDGLLTKKDFKKLLKEAEVSFVIRGLVAEFMLTTFDSNNDGTIDWEEFQAAIKETNLKKV